MPLDVIVIGSGPGGAAAAITCAAAGLRVAIISKRKKELNRPSESVHPGVGSLLNKLQIPNAIEAAALGKYKGIEVNGQFTPLGSDESGDWEGTHISREIFDACLLSAAEQQGVIIMNDTVNDVLSNNDRVIGVTTQSKKTIHASFVIDGSGRRRLAGKKMKFQEAVYSPPLVAWSGLAEYTGNKNTTFIPSADGWTWLAPHADGYCTWTCVSLTHHKKLLPPENLETVGAIHSANMQWRIFRPLCSEGLLLIGDAAAIIDPAAGQGILNALHSGIAAGQTVASCLHQPFNENFYLAAYDQWSVAQYEQKVNQLHSLYQLHGININSIFKKGLKHG